MKPRIHDVEASKPATKLNAMRDAAKAKKVNGSKRLVDPRFIQMNAVANGALAVIAKAKAAGEGEWSYPDAPKEKRNRFKLNRKEVAKRTARLAKRIGVTDPNSDSSQTNMEIAMSKKVTKSTKSTKSATRVTAAQIEDKKIVVGPTKELPREGGLRHKRIQLALAAKTVKAALAKTFKIDGEEHGIGMGNLKFMVEQGFIKLV